MYAMCHVAVCYQCESPKWGTRRLEEYACDAAREQRAVGNGARKSGETSQCHHRISRSGTCGHCPSNYIKRKRRTVRQGFGALNWRPKRAGALRNRPPYHHFVLQQGCRRQRNATHRGCGYGCQDQRNAGWRHRYAYRWH